MTARPAACSLMGQLARASVTDARHVSRTMQRRDDKQLLVGLSTLYVITEIKENRETQRVPALGLCCCEPFPHTQSEVDVSL
ncbi:hypothetical protein LZ31DRAFT_142537 [Colletotrichum somersetense]|nr:hypothetical protein LZ31DRAFT_142537 [Colletotrichum somersetense]